ncbi:methyl-accepting chemotaxis protein [uncultured Brachyspira sp.]|uniref:methyl-accepting chemotaxis protein n=1 Tax=uncultured Brachyspira sp. TaxID=221953 RepID=UPI002630EB9D|nr:methyl-accepting chemotaxis protein [uncultured Brachyspira sp.]
MKIKTKFIIFGIYTIISIAIRIILQINIRNSIKEFRSIYQYVIKSSSIARKYQQNSAFLTQFVRSYVATGDEKYEKAYNECIAISGGTQATPLKYDRGLYWALYLASGNKPYEDGETKSYEEVMKELNFSKEMFDYLNLSKSRSEELVELETKAMEIIKSIPKGTNNIIAPEYQARQLEAIELVNGKEYENSVYEIMQPIDNFFDKLESDNIIKLEEANNKVVRSNIIFYIVLMFVGISIFLFLVSIAKSIMKNLNLCVNLSSNISKGNLKIEIDEKLLNQKTEFAELLKSFKNMSDNLRDIISKVLQSSDRISTAATEISNGNDDLSNRTEMQASSLEQTASSMEEIASTIKSSADNSVYGNEMMKDSEISVREAGNIIEETTSNIELVYEASNKITDITKIIEGIASQTNILALNASVEAARAGEQGKGFAIVASEVRNLAQTSQSSVKNITLLIEDSNKKIKTAAETARKSLEIFRLIEEKITNTSKIMQDISSMAVEQQQGVYQVNTAITQMDSVTQQNASLVQESSAASQALMHQAKELVSLMEFFKV